jgi:hypothetical protein
MDIRPRRLGLVDGGCSMFAAIEKARIIDENERVGVNSQRLPAVVIVMVKRESKTFRSIA